VVDQPAEALNPRIGRGSRLLKVGVVAETVNLISLVILNFAGPALLDTARFGSYARSVGVAFLALGLVDSPLALGLLVKHTGAGVLRATYRKTLISVSVALPLGVLALDSTGALVASLCLCLAHSLGSSSISLGYRNARPELVISWYATVLLVLVTTIYAGSVLSWTAPEIVLVQSALLFAVGAVLLAFLIKLTAVTPFTERRVSAPILGMATYITGPLQWVLVLIAGAVFGSVEAAFVKVGSALMNLPLASVPLSGQLLLAHAHHSATKSGAAVRKRIGAVAAASVLIAVVVWLGRDVVFEILDLRSGETTKQLLPFLLLGGVGLAVFSTSWPITSSELLSSMQARIVLIFFAAGSLLVVSTVFVGPTQGLLGLMVLYVTAGVAAYLLTWAGVTSRDSSVSFRSPES
jgi:hypothetical protein